MAQNITWLIYRSTKNGVFHGSTTQHAPASPEGARDACAQALHIFGRRRSPGYTPGVRLIAVPARAENFGSPGARSIYSFVIREAVPNPPLELVEEPLDA
jgi:hypothetical protein